MEGEGTDNGIVLYVLSIIGEIEGRDTHSRLIALSQLILAEMGDDEHTLYGSWLCVAPIEKWIHYSACGINLLSVQ